MTHLFDNELAHLKEKLLTMGSQAESVVTRAVKALIERDDNLAWRVEADDEILDRLEIEIDDVSVALLAQAPLATDLRLITVAMKVSQNLERVGDEATKIARRAVELNREAPLKPYVDVPRMGAIAAEMLRAALDAFVNGNRELAAATIARDPEMNALNKQVHRELTSFMVENPATITRALHIMVAAKSLERIADHATNIAEEVIYLAEGRDVRHQHKSANLPTGQTAS
jgi:phosphate transport system protein